MNVLDQIFRKVSNLENPPRWIKLSIWCKKNGLSQTFALDCFRECISRPKGRIYMIDIDLANEMIEADKLNGNQKVNSSAIISLK